MTALDPHTAIDFTDPHTFDDPWETYALAPRPSTTCTTTTSTTSTSAPRHEDVFTLSRNEERYCSRFGVRPKIAGDMSIITLDGEEHTRQRRLINQGFTPRRVRELIPHVRKLTNEIVDQIADRDEIDFVDDFAIHVPLIIICEMLGLDPAQRLSMYALVRRDDGRATATSRPTRPSSTPRPRRSASTA